MANTSRTPTDAPPMPNHSLRAPPTNMTDIPMRTMMIMQEKWFSSIMSRHTPMTMPNGMNILYWEDSMKFERSLTFASNRS